MTNIYNGLIDNLERSLGLKRHDTEAALRDMAEPMNPDAMLRYLFGRQDSVRQWHEELHENGAEEGKATAESLGAAQEIGLKLINPVFSRDTRSNCFTRVGGNVLAGLMDIWVQQDQYAQKRPRSAHIVEYDMINMEAVKVAVEKMVQAIDESNRGRPARLKTGAQRFTDGYIRIVNGLVNEAFTDELRKAGIDDTDSHLYQARLSNGDEFRLVVAGLDSEQIAHAMQVAQEKVQQLVCDMGFDALPHLKHLGDDKKWANINTLQALSENEAVYKAFKYGGAGIKIGSVELGDGLPTSEVEHLLDLELHSSREKRAQERGDAIGRALIKLGTPEAKVIQQVFNNGHPLSSHELGTISFGDPKSFKKLMESVNDKRYQLYYRRPEVEVRDFPYPLPQERRNALPVNNPDEYAAEFLDIISNYVALTDSIRRRLQTIIRHDVQEIAPKNGHPYPEQLTTAIMKELARLLNGSHTPKDMATVLIARMQFEEKHETLSEKLREFCNTVNPYESFDLTRKRILDREAERLQLSDEQRDIYFRQPLQLINARHTDGYCMNGRIKEAVKIFQGEDKEERQYSYIGLSSFSGTNEVSTALGRSINDNIRSITADELRKRFGEKALDFAYNVESGRMNLLTHGISKNELTDALSEIEQRVEREINQQPLGALLRRYRIFTRQSEEMLLLPRQETDADIRHIADEIGIARDRQGHDTPLAFSFQQEGEVKSRPLNPDEISRHKDTIAAGNTLFLEQRSRDILVTPPNHVEEYLKRAGYVDGAGKLDLGKPLGILPNPKHIHEKGVRVITAYVALQGSSPTLAEQRKGELYRLVEYKKRKLYTPGKGHEVEIPVESNPHYTPASDSKPQHIPVANGIAGNGFHTARHRGHSAHTRNGTSHANDVRPSRPKDQAGWFRMLDQREFEMWQQRQVPETLLQVIAYPHIHVEADRSTFVIHVSRQNGGYDREDLEASSRRALFIKHALEEHFAEAAVVTGINPDTRGNRDIILRVRPKSADGKGHYDAGRLSPKEAELIKFFEDLTAIKARQSAGGNGIHKEAIAKALQQEADKYRYQLRAIRLMRQFPTIQIEAPRNDGGNFIIKMPQEPQERKSIWKERNDELLGALKGLLRDKAIECKEEEDMPFSSRSGGGSTKSRIKYVIRIESTPVSKDILKYMASLQQLPQPRVSLRA